MLSDKNVSVRALIMCGYLLLCLVLFDLPSFDDAAPTKQNDENPESLSSVQLQSPEVYPTEVVLQPTSLDKETGHQIYSSTNPTPEIHLQERGIFGNCLSFGRKSNQGGISKRRKFRRSSASNPASNSNSKIKLRNRRQNSSPPPGSPKNPLPTVVTTPAPAPAPAPVASPRKSPSFGDPSTWIGHGDHAMAWRPPNYPEVHIIPFREDPLEQLANSMHRSTWS